MKLLPFTAPSAKPNTWVKKCEGGWHRAWYFWSLLNYYPLTLKNGTIEVELSGKPGPNAYAGARGFVGLAFRIKEDNLPLNAFLSATRNSRLWIRPEGIILCSNILSGFIHGTNCAKRRRKFMNPMLTSFQESGPGKIVVKDEKARLYAWTKPANVGDQRPKIGSGSIGSYWSLDWAGYRSPFCQSCCERRSKENKSRENLANNPLLLQHSHHCLYNWMEINTYNHPYVTAEVTAQGLLLTTRAGCTMYGISLLPGYEKSFLPTPFPADFFQLSNGKLGEVLQNFSNFRMRLAIIGDFQNLQSQSLTDFIRESNPVIGRILFLHWKMLCNYLSKFNLASLSPILI